MSNLEMITAKIKRLNDKAIWAKERADDLKSMGDEDLYCIRYNKVPHEWVCYKRKILHDWFYYYPRIRGVKSWFECKVCGIEMILFKENYA
jgi:hypothetical protein